MRKTINISVSEHMYSFIREKGRSEFYDSTSDYIRALVRRDQYRGYKARSRQQTGRTNDIFERRDNSADEK
jgi:Arc/MetJ-type ribon-helix-helix transcriptional regulator